jgi:glycosidase
MVGQGRFFQVYLHSFADTDGDGVGDLKGIIEHQDYLFDLEIDAIWFSPLTRPHHFKS